MVAPDASLEEADSSVPSPEWLSSPASVRPITPAPSPAPANSDTSVKDAVKPGAVYEEYHTVDIAKGLAEDPPEGNGDAVEQKKGCFSCFKKKKKEDKPPAVSFLQLYRYADRADRVRMLVGGLASVLLGASLPVFCFLFGVVLDDLGAGDRDAVTRMAIILTGMGLGAWLLATLAVACFTVSGERQARRIRRSFFTAILDQVFCRPHRLAS